MNTISLSVSWTFLGDASILTYSFPLVGAGTGGSALANKLVTGLNASVLLIEAGGEMGFRSRIPLLCTFVQGTLSDWAFKTVPQPHSSHGFVNYQQKWPRGKGLGGSAQINYMLHSLGRPEDFDYWRDSFGLDRWSYKNFSCHLENVNCDAVEDQNLSELDLQEARLGYYLKRAEMEFQKDGVDAVQTNTARFTVRDGKRFSVYDEFIVPLLGHPKLHIMTHTVVSRVVLVGKDDGSEKRAVGVNLANSNDFIRARREIIVSAGAVQSPQLLLLSGIGPKQELAALKIPHHVQNKHVGHNLFDHMNVPLYVSIDLPISVTQSKVLSLAEVLKYLSGGKGIFSTSAMIGTATKKEKSSAGIILFGVGSVDEASLRKVSNLDYDAFKNVFPLHGNSTQEGFVLLATCYHPKTRGSISLHSRSIHDHPQIDPDYYAHPADIACTKEAIRLAMKLMDSETFERIGARVMWPKLTQCVNIDFQNKFDEYLECVIRTVGMTGHHPGGTCAMGRVVDQELR